MSWHWLEQKLKKNELKSERDKRWAIETLAWEKTKRTVRGLNKGTIEDAVRALDNPNEKPTKKYKRETLKRYIREAQENQQEMYQGIRRFLSKKYLGKEY